MAIPGFTGGEELTPVSGGLGDKLKNTLGNMNTGLGSGGIAGLLGMIPGVGSILGPIAGIGSAIAGAFTKPPDEKLKRDLEQRMRDVYEAWKRGETDADTATSMISGILNQFSGDPTRRGYMGSLASSFLSDIQAKRQQEINAPYKAGGETLTGGTATQRERGASLMRNMLMGTQSGNDFAANTPAGKLLAPRADVGEQFAKYKPQREGSIMDRVNAQSGGGVGSKITDALKRFGGY